MTFTEKAQELMKGCHNNLHHFKVRNGSAILDGQTFPRNADMRTTEPADTCKNCHGKELENISCPHCGNNKVTL